MDSLFGARAREMPKKLTTYAWQANMGLQCFVGEKIPAIVSAAPVLNNSSALGKLQFPCSQDTHLIG